MADVKKVLQVTGDQIDKALLPIARERYSGRYAQSDGQGGLKFVDGGGGSLATDQKAGIVKVYGPVTANPAFDITPIKIDSNGRIFASMPKAPMTDSLTPDKYRDYAAENDEGAVISQVCDNKSVGTGFPGLKCFVFTLATEYGRALKIRQVAIDTESTRMASRVEGTGTTWGPWVEDSGGSGGSGGVVDTAMSSTSANAVQNKVIKKYVDDMVGAIDKLVGSGV